MKDPTSVGVEIPQIYKRVKYVALWSQKKRKNYGSTQGAADWVCLCELAISVLVQYKKDIVIISLNLIYFHHDMTAKLLIWR